MLFDDFTTVTFTPVVGETIDVPVPKGKKVLSVNIQTNQDNDHEFQYDLYMGAYEREEEYEYLQKWFSFAPTDDDNEPIAPANINIAFYL